MSDKSVVLDGIDSERNYNMSKILNFIVILYFYTKLVNLAWLDLNLYTHC